MRMIQVVLSKISFTMMTLMALVVASTILSVSFTSTLVSVSTTHSSLFGIVVDAFTNNNLPNSSSSRGNGGVDYKKISNNIMYSRISSVPTSPIKNSGPTKTTMLELNSIQNNNNENDYDSENDFDPSIYYNHKSNVTDTSFHHPLDFQRRTILSSLLPATILTLLTPLSSSSQPAYAATPSSKTRQNLNLFVVPNRKNTTTASDMNPPSSTTLEYGPELQAEYLLLRLLPVKNIVFRTLEKNIVRVGSLTKTADYVDDLSKDPPSSKWDKIMKQLQDTLLYLDNQRLKLEPVFNQDDSTPILIAKAERGERLVEDVRNQLLQMMQGCTNRDELKITSAQKYALRKLASLGELLVESFPYSVPEEGKFSYLPRLLGRTEVTFTISRDKNRNQRTNVFGRERSGGSGNVILGNVTILADGFAAPITAGNFVDLSIRQFYTGLPVKAFRKKLGANPTLTAVEDEVAIDIANTLDQLTEEGSNVFDAINNIIGEATGNVRMDRNEIGDVVDKGSGTITTTIPILGSYYEGFYDPLTAKPRLIPLEIVQFDRNSRTAKLSYAQGFSTASQSQTLRSDVSSPNTKKQNNLLSFSIPGLVAMNHPDKNLNGGSSEFFCLSKKNLVSERTSLLDGAYAPFGYVLEGLEILQDIQPGDTITGTYVDEWGQLNLKKIKGGNFADAIQSADDEEDGEEVK